MNDRAAFMANIRADPYNQTPKLIYADWLQDRGGMTLCIECGGKGNIDTLGDQYLRACCYAYNTHKPDLRGWVAVVVNECSPRLKNLKQAKAWVEERCDVKLWRKLSRKNETSTIYAELRSYRCKSCVGTGFVSNGNTERAELIRTQCELSKRLLERSHVLLPCECDTDFCKGTCDSANLRHRAQELLSGMELRGWVGPLRGIPVVSPLYVWFDGFISRVHVNWDECCTYIEKIQEHSDVVLEDITLVNWGSYRESRQQLKRGNRCARLIGQPWVSTSDIKGWRQSMSRDEKTVALLQHYFPSNLGDASKPIKLKFIGVIRHNG